MKKILMALDRSEHALKIARYVADMVGGGSQAEVELLYVIRDFIPIHGEFDLGVLPEVQQRFEESSRQTMAETFAKVTQVLIEAGFEEANIKTEIKPGAMDVAQEILSEAETGDFGTIVVGRRGMGLVRQFLLGSVSNKVVQHARGRTVWVVE
jgi:nucleotide-binding universal stress UspA family protein